MLDIVIDARKSHDMIPQALHTCARVSVTGRAHRCHGYHGVSLMVPRAWSRPCVSRKGSGAEITPAVVLRYNFAVKILASHVTVTRQTFLLARCRTRGGRP